MSDLQVSKPLRACRTCRESEQALLHSMVQSQLIRMNRNRRVKCDETKPLCMRCSRSNRRCGGYLDPFQYHSAVDISADWVDTVNSRGTNVTGLTPYNISYIGLTSTVFSSEIDPANDGLLQDELSLHHFITQTGIRMPSVFDMNVWTESIPLMSTRFPAIRHALLALSAQHEMTLHGHDMSLDALRLYSYRQYGRSIERVNAILVDAVQNHDILLETLIACLLLVIFEVLRGSDVAALTHLDGAIHLVSIPSIAKYQLSLEEDNRAPYSPTSRSGLIKRISLIFQQLDLQAAMFASSRLPIAPEEVDSIANYRASNIPHGQKKYRGCGPAEFGFSNIIEANQALLSIQVNVSRFIGSKAVHWKYAPDLKRRSLNNDFDRIRREQQSILQQMHHWKSNLGDIVHVKETFNRAKGNIAALKEWSEFQEQCAPVVMLLSYWTSYILLSTSLSPDEIAYDTHIPTFARIVELSETILLRQPKNSAAETSVFCIDMKIIYPLYITAFKCRNNMIRHRAVHLLWMCGREGVWDGRMMASMAQCIISCEEEYAKHQWNHEPKTFDESSGEIITSIPEKARIHGASIVELDRHRRELRIACSRRVMLMSSDDENVWEEIPFDVRY